MANEKPARFITDAWTQCSDFGGFDFGGACNVGSLSGNADGALRFTNIDIGNAESFDMARLVLKYASVGGAGTWKFKAYGIDEDNTSSFGASPFGRSKTSAVQTVNEGEPTGGGTKTLDVKNLLEEITQRGGWSRNNAVGFHFMDDGSDSGVYAEFDIADSFLIYRISPEPNFFPSPVVLTAPTFPPADDYGMKISFPGFNSIGQTDETKLLYTSRKEVLKIKSEAQVNTTAGVELLISHGLGYKPECVVFLRKNDLSFELPRLFGGAADPVGGGVQGYVSVDSTYLRILTFDDAQVYYYILLDEQAT